MSLRTIAFAPALLVAFFATTAPALASSSDNYTLFRKIEQQVQRYPWTSVYDSVHIRVDNGRVELTGKVTMGFKRDGIGERVARVAGVSSVRNRIDVLPASQLDDDLRLRISRAIYANPHFRGYGSRVSPPIRIIVERGRVTLEGVVNNDTDRMIAQAIASSFGAFKFTNDLKTVAEAKAELEQL